MVHPCEYLLLPAVKYLIALGSNLGDRKRYLDCAIKLMELRCGRVIRQSAVYDTAPVGMKAELNFYNQVVVLESQLEPIELLQGLMDIECELGRVRLDEPGYSSRGIDLDILLAEDLVMKTEILQIPHPRMAERRFVLVPAVEIAPDWIHPSSKITLGELLSTCTDDAQVVRL